MFKKITLGIFLPILLIFSLGINNFNHIYVSASNEEVTDSEYLDGYFVQNDSETIALYSSIEDSLEVLIEIPNNSPVLIHEEFIDIDDEYIYVKYVDDNDNSKEYEGYVSKEDIVTEDDITYTNENNSDNETIENEDLDTEEGISDEDIAEDESDESENTISEEDITKEDNEANDTETTDEDTKSEITRDDSENEVLEIEKEKPVAMKSVKANNYTGVAKKSPTNIREKTSTSSKVIKRLDIGDVIKLKSHSTDWYEFSFLDNGKNKKGYIHRKHVTIVNTAPKPYVGVGKKSPTNVRAGASTKAKVIKKLPIGEVVDLKSFSKNWYEYSFVENGTNKKGYIHKKHVTIVNTVPKPYVGVGKKSPTNVRAGASTEAKVIKKLSIGEVVDLKSFSKNWYEYSFMENGTNKKGYIHKKHVTIVNTTPVDKRILTKKSPTNVRAGASTKAKVIKTYPKNYYVDLQTFSKNWYEVTFNENGATKKGYIHKKHVEDAQNHTFKGIAKKEKTNIRATTSTTSKILKTVPNGTVLSIQLHSKNWFKTTVDVGGKSVTGFIHKKHIDESIKNKTVKSVITLKQPTNIRTDASTKSKVAAKLNKNEKVDVKTFSDNWYEIETNVNGKRIIGYVHKKHVSDKLTIILDAGHGGSDPGASANGLLEKNLTLEITKRVASLLTGINLNVIMTRSDDRFLELSERSSLANDIGASLFVSIHINSGGGEGIETWWNDKNTKPGESNQLANNIQSEIIKSTNAKDRGVKGRTPNNGDFHVTRVPNMPSALVEVGFIDNKNDANKLKNNAFLQNAAQGIANGIKLFLNLL